jgi:arginyl-tRNA synthetase
MLLEENIKINIAKAFKELYGQNVDAESLKLESTNPDFKGDLTFVCFPFLRLSGKNPEATGNDLGQFVVDHVQEVKGYNVVKGFLNFEIDDAHWLSLFLNHQVEVRNKQNGHVMVEFSSPNTNKPLHLGHVRNIFLGASVSRILEAAGNRVVKCNLINDRGIHICKSMLAWQRFGNGETPESSGIKGDHLVGKYYVLFDKHYKEEIEKMCGEGIEKAQAEKNAPLMLEAQKMLRDWEANVPEVIELWKKMNSWVYDGFEKTYQKMGVSFDKMYYESDTYILGKNIVDEGLNAGVFYKKPDNSVWIDLTNEGLDEKLVLRSDGTSVYITQDIGTAQLKYDEFNCDQSIYVVGNEQDYHFKVLFLILKKLGKTWANGLFHLSYGMVDLPSGKMKSREGTVVDADDLMDEMVKSAEEKTEELGKTVGLSNEEKQTLYETLGLGALKFFLLKVDPPKRMLFNPAESIDLQGDTGPFVQYTYARIQSMMRAAQAKDLNQNVNISDAKESELALIKTLLEYEIEILKAAQLRSPAIIIAYALKIAKHFNKVYADVSILKESDVSKRRFRIRLSQLTAESIEKLMSMLGIACPQRM